MVLGEVISWDGDIPNTTVLGWALKRHVPLWDRNLDIQGRRPCEDGVRDWEWCSGMLRIVGKPQAKRAGSPQISRGSQACWHLGLRVTFCLFKSPGLWYFALAAPGTQGAFSFCLLPSGEVKENIAQMTQKPKNLRFGWLSAALAHFPLFLLDHIKRQPTQTKRAEHLRAVISW